MKYKLLRYWIKRFVDPKKFVLRNCTLVFDGRCIRGAAYQKSECEFLLGGELDRYASHLRTELEILKDNNMTCYFVFNGGRSVDNERRIEIYQDLIDTAAAMEPGQPTYVDPPFVKDVILEVLTDLGLKWFISEYNVRESLLSVARAYNCPIVTNNLEFCLYGISCIQWQSIANDYMTGNTIFDMYDADACRKAFFIKDALMPVFLTLVDEDGKIFEKIPEVINCRANNVMPELIRWIRRQTINHVMTLMMNHLDNDSDRKKIIDKYKEHHKLYNNYLHKVAVKYFQNPIQIELHRTDPKWFIKGVSNNRIAIAYVNLYHNRTLSGSWLVQDHKKEDAMLPVIEIIEYALGLLTNFQDTKITFFGRKADKCSAWDMEFKYEPQMANKELLKNTNKRVPKTIKVDFFRNFISKVMPGFNFQLLKVLNVPEDCWVLMITMVYYCLKNRDHLVAYSFLLSYVMLGPVTDKVGVIKMGNFNFRHNEMSYNKLCHTTDTDTAEGQGMTFQSCVAAAQKLMPLFNIDQDLANKYDRSLLHSFSEFQHCLHHMNHLNKLCGQKIKCTVYHKTINATFVFNAYQKMNGANPFQYFEDEMKNSPVLDYFKMLVGVFEQLMLIQNNNYY